MTDLVPVRPSAELERVDPLAAFVARADAAARAHQRDRRPPKTVQGYRRDWEVWTQWVDQVATPTAGVDVPHTMVTSGLLYAFVVWLDEDLQAPWSTVDRRITGVTVEGRTRGAVIDRSVTAAARDYVKAMKADPVKALRGRGKAVGTNPQELRQMAAALPSGPVAAARDQSLITMSFAIAGRAGEVGYLDTEGITPEGPGLRVWVPPIKGKPGRVVHVAPGEHRASCPVRSWYAWRRIYTPATGPAYVEVDRWDNLQEHRLTADACSAVVARSAQRAGLGRRTGHSQRRGLINTALQEGKPREKVAAQSGHAAGSKAFDAYVDDAARVSDPTTAGIGL